MLKVSPLWQRIFAWTTLLIVVSHGLSFLMFKSIFDNYEFKQQLIEHSIKLAAQLEHKQLNEITKLINAINDTDTRVWIEHPNGSLMAGKFIFEKQAFSASSLISGNSLGNALGNSLGSSLGNATTVLRSPAHEALYITATAFHTQDGPATMYLAARREDTPPLLKLFYQGFISMLVMGGVLSAWVAWRISQPLSKLCDEVMQIADGNLEMRVKVTAKGEVAQVAAAVNRLAENLAENIHKKRQILANVAHEMRSPLARMNVSMAIIEQGLPSERFSCDDKNLKNIEAHNKTMLATKHLCSMQKEIDHMERLIGSSLLTSKLTLQQQELELAPIALSELCTEMIRRHEPLMHSKGIKFSQEIKDKLWVNGDEELLCMVLSNLLDNAAKYTKEGGKVHCALCTEQGMAVLKVENSHHSIAETDLAAIFDPFYRGLGTGYDDGVGLGLALVEKIVEIHKGVVSAENSDLGLLFTIKLALLAQPIKQ